MSFETIEEVNLVDLSIIVSILLLLDVILTVPSWHLEGNIVAISMGVHWFVISHCIIVPLIICLSYSLEDIDNELYINLSKTCMISLIIWYVTLAIVPWLLYYMGVINI